MADVLARVDVVVVGAGPAGRAITSRAAAHGLTTAVVDPAPDRPWPATYGQWADELPTWLPPAVLAATIFDATATARTTHRLGRAYVVLDTAALQAALTADHPQHAPTAVVPAAALGTRPGHAPGTTAVVLPGGATVEAAVVVDATGTRRLLSALPAAGARAAQTAVGVVVPDDGRHPHAFMDWTSDHGEAGWPTFLYAVPLGPDEDGAPRLLLEETSLARRPGLDLAVLRRRLRRRLAARGVPWPDRPEIEHVRITVDLPPTRGVGSTVAVGAAAGLIHPATGYSLAASLGTADPVARALADALADARAERGRPPAERGRPAADGRRAAEAARRVLWPPQALAVHHLRRRGLEALLALPPAGVLDFFERFLSLPPHLQRAYLSGRDDLAGTAAAMAAVFAAADGPLRRHLLRWGVRPIGDVPPSPG